VRALKRFGVVALVVLVLVGLALVSTAAAYALWAATGTDDARLEALRWRVAWTVVKVFGISARPMHARAMMAILGNELPPGWTPGEPVIGDEGFSGGPSVGPGQVYRATAKALGLWTPPGEGMTDEEERAAYRVLAADEPLMVEWAVRVFADKLHQAENAAGEDASEEDILADAVRRYNGSGRLAVAYRERAVTRAEGWWGGFTG
jgi:hypothetical protein